MSALPFASNSFLNPKHARQANSHRPHQGPGPGPPKELSFTKSSQAVRAVRAVLAAACSSQWEQLQGLGGDEDGLQKPGTEGGRPPQVTHPSPGYPHRAPGPVPAQEWRMETVPSTGWDPKPCQGLEPPPCNHESAPLAAARGAERACPGTPSGFRGDEAQGGHGAGRGWGWGRRTRTSMRVDTGYRIWACVCPQVAWGAGRMEEEEKDFNHRFRAGSSCAAQPQAAKDTLTVCLLFGSRR